MQLPVRDSKCNLEQTEAGRLGGRFPIRVALGRNEGPRGDGFARPAHPKRRTWGVGREGRRAVIEEGGGSRLPSRFGSRACDDRDNHAASW
jgi:hypothetical protein